MLRLDDVSKQFGGVHALSAVSFEVYPGTVTSIIGPNGAGKTTLFNLISGRLPVTSGRIRLKDVDITNWPAHRIAAAGVGRTFQNIELFPTLNALENVIAARYHRTRSTLLDACVFSRRDRTERRRNRELAGELLATAGIYERRLSMPKELSYGNQRRLEIARALATEPEMLMLDEPAAGLVQRAVGELMELVTSLKASGMTILLIEHQVGVVLSVSDKVVVLNFGEKIAEGEPDDVRRDPAVIDAYLGPQD